MSDWRQRVVERERDPKRNCASCEHYCSAGRDGAPVCLQWSKLNDRVYVIGVGRSGLRNDAPFCQFFEQSAAARRSPP